jgi:hypothetical protein
LQSTPWDGNPISAGGCYSGIELDHYHGNLCIDPSTSSSALRKLYMQSPAHYYDESYLNPNRQIDDEEKMDREWKALGNAAHHLFIGAPGEFRENFVIRPDVAPDGRAWNMNNKGCKRWVADAHRNGKVVLSPGQIETIKRMAENLARHPVTAGGVLDGLIERSLVWRDAETGLWCKARPDVLLPESAEVTDIKTTRSVLLPDLTRSAAELGYHQQGALVADGMKAIFGIEMTGFILVWLEKPRPNCVRVTSVDADDLARGRMQNRVALRTLANCIEHDHWPGPGETDELVADLKLSMAARERIDARLKIEGMLQ